jgi:hypothetical protein
MEKRILITRGSTKALLALASTEAQLVMATRFASALDSRSSQWQ